MASFRQRNNKWQARVSRNGYPDQVKTFEAKGDAERWARSVESEMDKGHFVDTQEAQRTPLRELILRYVQEVTPTMKSVNEDTIRLKAMARKPIANWSLEISTLRGSPPTETNASKKSATEPSFENWHICLPSSIMHESGESIRPTRKRLAFLDRVFLEQKAPCSSPAKK